MFPPNFCQLSPADRTLWFFSSVRIANRRQLYAFSELCALADGEQPRKLRAWQALTAARMRRTLSHLLAERQLVSSDVFPAGNVGPYLQRPLFDTATEARDFAAMAYFAQAQDFILRWDSQPAHIGTEHFIGPAYQRALIADHWPSTRDRSHLLISNCTLTAVFLTLLRQAVTTPRLIADWTLVNHRREPGSHPQIWASYRLAEQDIEVSVDPPPHGMRVDVGQYLLALVDEADLKGVRRQLWAPEG